MDTPGDGAGYGVGYGAYHGVGDRGGDTTLILILYLILFLLSFFLCVAFFLWIVSGFRLQLPTRHQIRHQEEGSSKNLNRVMALRNPAPCSGGRYRLLMLFGLTIRFILPSGHFDLMGRVGLSFDFLRAR